MSARGTICSRARVEPADARCGHARGVSSAKSPAGTILRLERPRSVKSPLSPSRFPTRARSHTNAQVRRCFGASWQRRQPFDEPSASNADFPAGPGAAGKAGVGQPRVRVSTHEFVSVETFHGLGQIHASQNGEVRKLPSAPGGRRGKAGLRIVGISVWQAHFWNKGLTRAG